MRIEIDIEGEALADTEIIEIDQGAHRRAIVLAASTKSGINIEELLLFEEDCDEPLDLDVIFNPDRSGIVHHVHRAREIEVFVNYNRPQPISRRFAPSARIQRVLAWATGPDGYGIDPTIVPEMELALHGTTDELPKRAHIGRYVKHPEHKLELDLIRGIVPNGSDSE